MKAGLYLVLSGLAVLAIVFAYNHYWATSAKDRIILPITLAVDSTQATTLAARSNAHYAIEVSAESKSVEDVEKLRCLFGSPVSYLDRCNVAAELFATWTVIKDGNIVASGTSDKDRGIGGGDGDYRISRTVGKFTSHKRGNYLVTVHFTGDAPNLNQLRPHLIVERDIPAEWNEALSTLIVLSLATLVGALLFIAGLAIVVWRFLRDRLTPRPVARQ